ncbi:hypothetical protein [Sulfurimonas sp.]|uniref:hypothetical protein n=1 Tax=Sulfurimonas sp. TaxID=2022749 RepID=UPI00356A4B3C
MEFLKKYKILIFRSVGILMLLIGFVIHFWVTPKEGFTQNEIAAANVARMEAVVAKGSGSGSSKPQEKDTSKYLEEFKNTRAKQMQYLTIIAMLMGVGFFGYSFIKKDKVQE